MLKLLAVSKQPYPVFALKRLKNISNELAELCKICDLFFTCQLLLRLKQGFLTWGASTPRWCSNQFQGVLGKVIYVAVKDKRNMMYCTCLFFILIVTTF